MLDEPYNFDTLSDAGRARGEVILAEAVALGAAIARRRRRRRTAGAAAVLGVAIFGVVFVARQFTASREVVAVSPSPRPSPGVPIESASGDGRRLIARRPPTEATPRIVIATIAPDPTIVARYATRPIESRVEHIGDDGLLKALADAGMPGGLATIGGTTRLVLDGHAAQ